MASIQMYNSQTGEISQADDSILQNIQQTPVKIYHWVDDNKILLAEVTLGVIAIGGIIYLTMALLPAEALAAGLTMLRTAGPKLIDGLKSLNKIPPAELEELEKAASNPFKVGNGNNPFFALTPFIFKSFFDQAKAATIPVDPLLIDLDNDGIETTPLNNGTYFDHNKDGFAELSAWVGEDDGILVIDKNNDGVINNGNEIFGDNYVKSNGTTATNGFDALKDLDTNNDNIINTNDTAFSSLKIAKGDGTLLTLAEAGISSINLGYSNTYTTDTNGNTQIHAGTYTKTNGTTGQIGNYNLQANKTYSIATEWVTESESIEALPDIQGFGTVYSLHQAMARDTQLQALVEAFVAEPTLSQKHTLLNQILVKWSGCEGVASDSRGTFIDGQKLAVLEKFMGEGFVSNINNNPNPIIQAANLLNSAYIQLNDYMFAQLASQTFLKEYYDLIEINWNVETQSIEYDVANVITAIQEKIAIDENAGKSALIEFCSSFKVLGFENSSNYQEFYNAFEAMGSEYKLILNIAGKISIYGTSVADSLEGTASAEAIFGLDGNDTILSRQGDDVVYGGAGDDYINTCEGNDYAEGGAGNDTIAGVYGNDTIYGGDGNDSLEGNAGDDIINGDAGNDFIDGGEGNDSLFGGAGDDTIKGEDGNNTIQGGAGNDIIYNTYFGNNTGDDTYIFNLGDGQDTINSMRGNDTIKFGEGITLNNVRFSGNYSDLVIFIGNNGDSIRIGGHLLDPMYAVERFEFKDGTVLTAEQVLPLLENRGTGGNDLLRGSCIADKMYGYAGNDSLAGLDGNDTIYGGDGNDSLEGCYGDDIINGDAGNDFIDGGEGNDSLYGGAGDDTLTGTEGADTLNGGAGNDTYILDDANDTVVEEVNQGIDLVRTGFSHTLANNVENLLLTGYSNINGTGNSLNNTLIGNYGNNVLNGGAGDDILTGISGADTLNGGLGNDSYGVHSTIAVVNEGQNQGIDTVYTSLESYTLGANVENLNLTGYDIDPNTGNLIIRGYGLNGYGNNLNNAITGNSYNNTFMGFGGSDTITDIAGNDTYKFNKGDSIDFITDYAGNDKFQFGAGIDKNKIAIFLDSSNRLQIDYGDTLMADGIAVAGWNNSANQIERFELDNGQYLTNDDINHMIQAIAAFTSDRGLSFSSVEDVKTNSELMTIISNNWHGV